MENEKQFVVSETPLSMWHYHLRLVGEEDGKISGFAKKALCGQEVGWDTKIPLSAYNEKSHIPQHWCQKCWEIYCSSRS